MIKNTDIEKFYNRIDGHIKIASVISENKYIYNIIKSCRLKPFSAFDNNFNFKSKLEKNWADEFGNSLFIDKNIANIIYADPLVPISSSIITSDLFYGSPIKQIKDKSKLIFIGAKNNDTKIISFYGKDEYFRTFLVDKKIVRASPLSMGLITMRSIFENINIGLYKRLDGLDYEDAKEAFVYKLPTQNEEINKMIDKEIEK